MDRDKAVRVTLFLLRVIAGLLFMHHGATKLFGWFGGMPPDGGHAELVSKIGLAGTLEFVGGALIVLGIATRPVAFVLSGEMAVAYWTAHAPAGPWPAQNHGEPAVLFCFIYLFFAAYGGGDWSLDALWRRHRGKGAVVEVAGGPES